MITKTLRTLSGPVKIKIPENLNEATLGAMIQMQSVTENEIPLIPGLTREICDNIIEFQDLTDIRDRVLSLAHQIKYCYEGTKLPEYVVFGYKKKWLRTVPNKIKVIKNLSIEPAGAYLASRNLIVDEINRHIAIYGEDNWQANFIPSLDICAGILANYFYCPVTGLLWNEQRAETFKSEVLKLSVQDALPISRYFFLNYNDLWRPKTSPWLRFKLKLNERRVYRNLKNSRS